MERDGSPTLNAPRSAMDLCVQLPRDMDTQKLGG